jgi:SAM-dependent methyltransferase
MHASALAAGKAFFQCYPPAAGALVLDMSALAINGSLRTVAPATCNYVGADRNVGKGVDVVVNDTTHLPFGSASFDVVLSSSSMEHDQFFWLSFLEVLRVLKDSGMFYLNVPTNGYYHRFPTDSWRFYPDAGKALEAWGKHKGYRVELIESFVMPQHQGELWNDFVAVFHKTAGNGLAPAPMLFKQFDGAVNVWTSNSIYPVYERKLPEDRHKLMDANFRLNELEPTQKIATTPATQNPVCNLCGSTSFGPGPAGRMAITGSPPCCLQCGSLERHRIVRKVMQSLPLGFLDWRKGLQFSADNGINREWLHSYEISEFCGANSIDLQSIARAEASYDLISFNHVLEFVEDAQTAFDELLRILSPHGIIQATFSTPMMREKTLDFTEPVGPHQHWHLFGKDLATYFECARKGVQVVAILEADPSTGSREVVHFFVRQPADALRIPGWLLAWSDSGISRNE